MRDENRDRAAIFQLIAQKSNLSAEEVWKMYARQAQQRWPSHPTTLIREGAVCGLIPVRPPDVQRLLVYLKQGMMYASQGHYELALNEFEQVRKVDPNFLAMHENVAAAQLKLKQFAEAESHLEEELKLVGCFEKAKDAELGDFAYMLEVERAAQNPGGTRVQEMRNRIRQARNTAHYNLACIRSRQGNSELALKEMGEAIDGGFSDMTALRNDPDLAGLRGTSGFQKLLSAAAKPETAR
jgi:tetratricopeptide (TPR) repeat protein